MSNQQSKYGFSILLFRDPNRNFAVYRVLIAHRVNSRRTCFFGCIVSCYESLIPQVSASYLQACVVVCIILICFLLLWLHSDYELIVSKSALFTCRYVVSSAKLPIFSRLYSNRMSIGFLSGLRCRLNRVGL